jgi:formamidopyrimidine-DNA glycosylase
VEGVESDPRAGRVFRPGGPGALAAGLAGARVAAVDRRGKHLLVSLESPRGPVGLLSHLGMTGKWVRREGGDPAGHSRARLRLDDGATLHFVDPRLFGRLRLVPGARFEEVAELRALGPDPLHDGIDPRRLAARLAATRRPVKVALLDQRILPGVGNIHASEALFLARVDPRRRADRLAPAEVRALARAVLASIRRTIREEDGPEVVYVEEPGAPNPFRVYGREGERCPRCRGADIRRAVQAQRSTYWCPRCQPPRPGRPAPGARAAARTGPAARPRGRRGAGGEGAAAPGGGRGSGGAGPAARGEGRGSGGARPAPRARRRGAGTTRPRGDAGDPVG